MLMPTRAGGRSVVLGGWLVRWRRPPIASPMTPTPPGRGRGRPGRSPRCARPRGPVWPGAAPPAEAELAELPGAEVLDQGIAASTRRSTIPAAFGCFRFSVMQRLLRAWLDHQERVAVELLAPLSHGITARRLDLDDVRAKIARQP